MLFNLKLTRNTEATSTPEDFELIQQISVEIQLTMSWNDWTSILRRLTDAKSVDKIVYHSG